jgi:dipeptidyl aminopeptidase/acylaminoacyl peptidase
MELDAAAVIGGITDLEQWYTERGTPLQNDLNELVGRPETNKEEYLNRSAVYWADQINVPLLILHGENDQSVPVTQADALAEKLNELGKEYQYIKYPNADHALSDYFQEYTEEIMNWYDSKIQQ